MAKFLDEIGLSYFYGKLKSKFSNYVYVGTNPPADLPVNAIWIDPSEEGDGSWADISDMVKSVNGKAPDADGNVNVKEYTHPASGVTAGSYRKVTVDTLGHVTAGENPILAVAEGGTGATTASDALSNLGGVPTSDVANSANKIPRYNANGHLVLPDGSEFWIA